jgi:NADPH:quinone reductase-like Zn-dependent oxidoreductase
LSGYKVVTVASKHNWDLVKSLGASAVYDYTDPEVVSHIQQWAQDNGFSSINKGLDTISEGGSIETCVAIMNNGGTLITLRKLEVNSLYRLTNKTGPPPQDLDSKGVKVYNVFVYTVLKPNNAEDFSHITDWHKRIPEYIESGKLGKGVVPLKVFSGGLDDLPEALDYVRQGKTSGQKVVITLK